MNLEEEFSMFLVVQNITVKSENRQKAIDALANRTILKEQKGFIDLSVMNNQDKEDVIGVIGRWESKADWQAWENHEDRDKVETFPTENVETAFYELIGQV